MQNIIILCRKTVIIYALLIISLRIMGKRQIGELEASEFIATLLLSEIAAIPIAEKDIPITNAIFPLLVILVLEISISLIVSKNRKIKKFIDGAPSFIMVKGRLCFENLKKARITLDELISELRSLGFPDISKISYIILEPNGKLSAFPNDGADAESSGIAHTIIIDSFINTSTLQALSLRREKILKGLSVAGYTIKDVLILTVNDNNEYFVMTKKDLFFKRIKI